MTTDTALLHGTREAASVPGDLTARYAISAGDTGGRMRAILGACTGCAVPLNCSGRT